MSKRSSIRRASSFSGPSGLAEVTWDPDRMPKLQWIAQAGGSGGSQLAVPVLALPGGGQIAPPDDPHGLVQKKVVLLPSKLGPRMSTPELLGRLEEFIHKYCDIPPVWDKLIAHYCLMTWVYDRFSAVPYLRFLGEPQSGKTRCLMSAAQLCFKPVIGGGSTSSSALFRLLDIWRGTFVIDEADFGKADLWSDVIKILNNGYMAGLAVLRAEKNGTSFDPCAFDVYGPKILSTRREFEDLALETRCITLRMDDRSVDARIPRQLPPEFYAESLELRNLCLQWRLDNYSLISGEQSELLQLSPRTAQIGIPLWAIADSNFKMDLLDLLNGQSRELRDSTPAALLAETLRQMTTNTLIWPQELRIGDIASYACQVSEDLGHPQKFSAKDISTLLKAFHLPPQRVGGFFQVSLTRESMERINARYSSK